MEVLIVGGGVSGLSTALCLASTFERIQKIERAGKEDFSVFSNPSRPSITVLADSFLQETVSIGAAGYIRPDANFSPSRSQNEIWAKNTLDYYYQLAQTTEAKESGVQIVSGYHLTSSPKDDPAWLEDRRFIGNVTRSGARDVTSEELASFPKEVTTGLFYTTIISDPILYLPWLMKKLRYLGVTFLKKKLSSLDDCGTHWDVIVNCTGLGAKQLISDKGMYPKRGQTMKASAPWIKHFYHWDGAYILPGVNYVTLGGVKQANNWNLSLSTDDKNLIWSRCVQLQPSIQEAPIAWEWVGLRPYRHGGVRVELEKSREGKVPIVHNYGHGANGFTYSWGTARTAVELILDAMNLSTYSKYVTNVLNVECNQTGAKL